MIALVEERIERSSYYRKLLGASMQIAHMPMEGTQSVNASNICDIVSCSGTFCFFLCYCALLISLDNGAGANIEQRYEVERYFPLSCSM